MRTEQEIKNKISELDRFYKKADDPNQDVELEEDDRRYLNGALDALDYVLGTFELDEIGGYEIKEGVE